jgi:hypothetical protein
MKNKMKKCMKGDGKLSRKLLTILVLAAMPMSGMALAAGTATGPNSVYVEQVGSTNTIAIEQVGGSNNVGGTAGTISIDSVGVTTLTPTAPSSLNYGTVNGSNNTLSLIQHGTGNSGQYNIKGNYNNYSSTVTGDGNQTNLIMGDTNTNTTNSTATETITGNQNVIIQQIVGDHINSVTSILGNNNQVTNNFLSTNGSASNTIVGNYNITNSQQLDSAGGVGHQLVMNTQGDYNSIVTQQQGSNDTTINIATSGNHNTITVRSSSAAIVNPMTAVPR